MEVLFSCRQDQSGIFLSACEEDEVLAVVLTKSTGMPPQITKGLPNCMIRHLLGIFADCLQNGHTCFAKYRQVLHAITSADARKIGTLKVVRK